MNIPDYLSHHYTSTSSTNIFNFVISGAGGSGKTTSLLETYRRLLKNSVKTQDDKLLVPIYIPASKLVRSRDDIYPVHKYIIQNYLPVNPGDNFNALYPVLESNILKRKDSKMQFVLLIDALNENFQYRVMVEEIRQISEMCNVSVCVSFKGNSANLSLTSFKLLRIKELNENVVDNSIDNRDVDSRLSELLRIPFYLSKYVEINHDDSINANVFTSYDLLEKYYRTLLENQLINNQYSPCTDPDKRRQEIEVSFDKVAPVIAFVLSRKKSSGDTFDGFSTSMMFTTDDTNLMNEIHGISVYNNVGIYQTLINDIEYTVESYLEPMGIIVRKTNRQDTHTYYEFSHEFIRDFLCTAYIKNCINQCKIITDKDYQKFPTDIIDNMLSQAIIHENCFIKKDDGSFNYKGFDQNKQDENEGLEQCLELFSIKKSNADKNVTLANLCFFTYVLLQSLHNNDHRKMQFCKSYVKMTSKIIDIIDERYIASGRIYLSNAVLKLIRLHAEMLRRAKEYKKSIEYSDKVIYLCNKGLKNSNWQKYIDSDTLERHIKASINNKCKVVIEEQYVFIKAGQNADEEKLIEAISQLDANDYSSSANLIALLIYQPNPLMKPYIDTFCKKKGIRDREIYAFNKYRQSIIFSYIHEPSMPGSWSYSLIKAIGFLLDNAVSVRSDGGCFIMDSFISDKTLFIPFDENLCKESYEFALDLIEELENTEASNSLYILRVKHLLRTNCSDTTRILSYSKILSYDEKLSTNSKKDYKVKSPFMEFISLILENDDLELLNKIKEKLVSLVNDRKYDAYDAIYILDDIRFAWDMLKSVRQHSQEFYSAVTNFLDIDLSKI